MKLWHLHIWAPVVFEIRKKRASWMCLCVSRMEPHLKMWEANKWTVSFGEKTYLIKVLAVPATGGNREQKWALPRAVVIKTSQRRCFRKLQVHLGLRVHSSDRAGPVFLLESRVKSYQVWGNRSLPRLQRKITMKEEYNCSKYSSSRMTIQF